MTSAGLSRKTLFTIKKNLKKINHSKRTQNPVNTSWHICSNTAVYEEWNTSRMYCPNDTLSHTGAAGVSVYSVKPLLLSFLYVWHHDTCDFTCSDIVTKTHPHEHTRRYSQDVRMRSDTVQLFLRMTDFHQCRCLFFLVNYGMLYVSRGSRVCIRHVWQKHTRR